MADTSVTDQLNTSTTTTSSPPAPASRRNRAVDRIYDEFDLYDHNDEVVDRDDDVRYDPFFDTLPPGYRFCPEDYELIVHYLSRKVYGKPLPPNRIVEVNIYGFNPEDLAEKYNEFGEREWYFFTSRDRKYPNGKRPKRAAGGGYWKATGADRKIYHEGKVVGYRKTLVFYKGKAQCGDKTNWIMHEYRVDNVPLRQRKGPADMILDKYILCRIYKKTDGVRARLRVRDPAVAENEDEVLDDENDGSSEAHSDLGPMVPMLPTSMYEAPTFVDSAYHQMGTNPMVYSDMLMSTYNIPVPVGGARHQAGSYLNQALNLGNNGSYLSQALNLGSNGSYLSQSLNISNSGSYLNGSGNNGSYLSSSAPNQRSMEGLGSMGQAQSSVAALVNPNQVSSNKSDQVDPSQLLTKPERGVQDWMHSMNHEDQYLNLNYAES